MQANYRAQHNTYHPKGEIVVKIVRLQLGRFSVRIGRMNFHFILRLVKYSVRRSNRGHHILHRVAKLNCLLKQSNKMIINHHAADHFLTFKYSEVFPRAGKLDRHGWGQLMLGEADGGTIRAKGSRLSDRDRAWIASERAKRGN